MQVNRLRRKIERDPSNPLIVQTVGRVGYGGSRRPENDDGAGGKPRRRHRTIAQSAGQLADAANAVAGVFAVALRPIVGPIAGNWDRLGRFLKSVMPKGLYARSLLIIIVPMVVLQSVVAFLFMERHWNLVTTYLSSAVRRRSRP